MARTLLFVGHDHPRSIQRGDPQMAGAPRGRAPAIGGTLRMCRRAARRGAARHNPFPIGSAGPEAVTRPIMYPRFRCLLGVVHRSIAVGVLWPTMTPTCVVSWTGERSRRRRELPGPPQTSPGTGPCPQAAPPPGDRAPFPSVTAPRAGSCSGLPTQHAFDLRSHGFAALRSAGRVLPSPLCRTADGSRGS